MNQQGFTMIEMVITLVILAVLGTTAGYGLTSGVRAFSDSVDVLQTLDKLRYTSERITREVREIRRENSNPANLDISAMSSSTLSFTGSNGTAVTLIASPPIVTLAYDIPVGTWTLTDEVHSLTFTYLQSDGITPATNNSDVAYIEFDLELSRAGKIYPQRARVALRNR